MWLNYEIVWCTIGHRAQYIGHNFSYLKGSGVIHEGPSHHEEMSTSGTENLAPSFTREVARPLEPRMGAIDQRRHAHTDSRPLVSTVCFAVPQSRRKSSKSSKKQCPRRYPVGNFIFDSTKKIISPRATFGRHAKSATLLLSSDSGRMAK